MAGQRAPRAYRWVVAAASYVVPRRLRGEWKRRWDNDIWNWWAFLAEHGALDRDARSQLLRHSWSAFPEAFRLRWAASGGRIVTFLRNPALCLALMLAPLAAAGLWTGFSGIRALVEPLAYRDAERLVLLPESRRTTVEAWRRAVRVEALSVYGTGWSTLAGRPVLYGRAEAGFFDLLGARPALGRLFEPKDAYGAPAAVLSDRLWRAAFAADPGVVGRTIALDGAAYRVLGVLPPDFWFYRREIALWTVLAPPPPPEPDRRRPAAVARLKDFAVPAEAERELNRIAGARGDRGRAHAVPIEARLSFALRYYLTVLGLAMAAVAVCAWAGFRQSRRAAVFLGVKSFLLLAGLAALAIEAPAAAATVAAGRAWFMEVWFPVAALLAVWWCWHDQRRRCRVCNRRLTLPVSFGNWGSPLLDGVGTELVCTRGHGTLYVPGMHWSSSEPERWTSFDASYNDLFTGKGPP